MTGKIGWAGAAVALGLAAAGWYVLGGGTPQEAKKNPLGDRDLGVYYRMTAEYTYKGEPLVLDFGISCTSIWSDPNQHKYSMDVFAGPRLYGVRTKDNKAVVISTRGYCLLHCGVKQRAEQGRIIPESRHQCAVNISIALMRLDRT